MFRMHAYRPRGWRARRGQFLLRRSALKCSRSRSANAMGTKNVTPRGTKHQCLPRETGDRWQVVVLEPTHDTCQDAHDRQRQQQRTVAWKVTIQHFNGPNLVLGQEFGAYFVDRGCPADCFAGRSLVVREKNYEKRKRPYKRRSPQVHLIFNVLHPRLPRHVVHSFDSAALAPSR
jgi:hypothetical protein